MATDDGKIRTFDTGATRDTAEDKHDPEGFLSPLVINRFCEYMHKNRMQSDGNLRDSDNWQNGFGFPVLAKSIWRHFKDVWTLHRGHEVIRKEKGKTVKINMEDALCGLMFNAMAYLHEHLVAKSVLAKAKNDYDAHREARNLKLRAFLKATGV